MTILCPVLFLLVKSTNDAEIAITIAKAIAATVPNPADAFTELGCEVAEGELDVLEVERIIVVAVVLESVFTLLNVAELVVLLIKVIEAGKLSSILA